MPYHLGVDVGTTYTAAAVGRHARAEAVALGIRSVSVPTVVYLAGDQFLVGEPAARRAITDPVRVGREFKRRVGDPTPLLVGGSPAAAELLMARVVHWVADRVAATEGEPPASLAVTHPANWGEFKLDLLRQALRHGGVPADHLVPEPVAAATAYATQREPAPGTVVAVYDLGGGTFDAALVRAGVEGFEIVGRPDGIERLGGIDFDHAVFRHVLDALGLDPDTLDDVDPGTATGLAQLREECVDAKEALSSETDVSIPVMLPQRHTEVRLTRTELEAMIRPALDETLVALRRAIASADVAVRDVDRVLLVGGSSRIPLVGQMVTAALDRPIAVDARPKDAIALGAALTAVAAAPRTAPVPPTPVVVPAPGGVGGAPHRAPAPPPPPHSAPSLYPAPPPGPDATRDRRVLMAVLVAIILVAGAVGAFALLSDGDDPQSSFGSTPTTTTERAPRTTTTPDEPSGEPTPLPGSDWNGEARAQFVADCGRLVGEEVGGVIGASQIGPACGCAYDELEQAGEVTFADFNAMWVADDIEPSDPTLRAFSNAFISCAAGTN